jgi:hypothetical protein
MAFWGTKRDSFNDKFEITEVSNYIAKNLEFGIWKLESALKMKL